MATVRKSQKSTFRPHPQKRPKGIGAGRTLFAWKARLPWLVIAAEQLCVVDAGSADALLEEREWVLNWNLTAEGLCRELEQLFPGIGAYLDGVKIWGKTSWKELLRNRVYKMYYSGTSDRGPDHDPYTRATISREHWRYWPCRKQWEAKVLAIVSQRLVFRQWRVWL